MEGKPRLIDAEMKDRLLGALCDHIPVGSRSKLLSEDIQVIYTNLGIKEREYHAILETFVEEGLVEAPSHGGSEGLYYSIVSINAAAHTFLYEEGGYTLRSEAFKADIEKLLTECEQLKRSDSIPAKLKETAKAVADVVSKVAPLLGLS